MKIFFNLDDTLRNTSERLATFYVKEKPDSNITPDDIDLSRLRDTLVFSDEEEYLDFFENYFLEIFGSAKDQYWNSNRDFNELVKFLEENGHEVFIAQKETGKIKSASFFFISDRQLDVNRVLFSDSLDGLLEECDLIVAANPKIITHAMGNGIKTIRVKRHYNEDLLSDFSVNEIKDIFNLDIWS